MTMELNALSGLSLTFSYTFQYHFGGFRHSIFGDPSFWLLKNMIRMTDPIKILEFAEIFQKFIRNGQMIVENPLKNQ
jgi:hypothetical protein